MSELNVNERIDVFFKNKTYIFIKLSSGTIFNGYIISISDAGVIKFKDDLLGKIPILIKEIEIINYSDKKRGENDESTC